MGFIKRFLRQTPSRGVEGGRSRVGSVGFRRVFWLLMLVAHAPGFVGAWESLFASGFTPDQFAVCLFLTGSMAFFVLKIQDVRWLSFRFDRHSWVAISIIVALLHTNAIHRHSGLDVSGPVTPYVAVLATSWLANRLPLVRRTLRDIVARSAASLKQFQPSNGPTETIWIDLFRPRCWVLAFRTFSLRAPPA